MELAAKLAPLPLIFTIDKLLNLAAQTIQRSPCLPRVNQIGHDHLQSLPLLDSSLKVYSAHVHFEGSLDFRSLSIDKDHVLLLSGSLFF